MTEICNEKVKISYPTFWEYKLILSKDCDENDIIKNTVGSREHKLVFSNHSKNGKFKSFNLNVLINNDEERLELFSLLKKYAKLVL